MKVKNIIYPLAAAVAGLLLSGCIYTQPPPPPPPPGPPVVEEEPPIPDDYYWDGYEYVGYVGGTCYYLGGGNVWIIADPIRLGRIHGWEHDHPDWHAHVIVNERFRNDVHGHFHARVAHGERRDDRH